MLDYYKVLGIERNSSIDDVKQAFRKNALKFHPERNNSTDAKQLFDSISEAYDVLSDAQKRALYDQYGENGLKSGVMTLSGFQQGYKFHGNSQEVFLSFFGGKNPFSELFAAPSTKTKAPAEFGTKFGGLHGMNANNNTASSFDPSKITQDPAVEKELPLTLEELYEGVVKKVRVNRKVLNDDGVTTSPQEKVFTMEVGKGYKAGTRITFTKEGDQGPNRIPADVVFVVSELPHATYKREGNDLTHTVELPLLQALTGTVVNLVTLDGRQLKIPVHEVIHPQFTKVVPNEGMPLSKNPSQRGNLVLHFKINFPTYFSDNQKRSLVKAFESH